MSPSSPDKDRLGWIRAFNPYVTGGHVRNRRISTPFDVVRENRLVESAFRRSEFAFGAALAQIRRLGIEVGQSLGRGSFAKAFALQGPWVLKITTDPTEAAAAEVVRTLPRVAYAPGVPDVRAVFEINIEDAAGGYDFDPDLDRLFGIVVERLRTDVLPREARRFAEDLEGYRGFFERSGGVDPSAIIPALDARPAHERTRLMRLADSMLYLQDHGVFPEDLATTGNILTRGMGEFEDRDLVMSDLGMAFAPRSYVPFLDEWAEGDAVAKLERVTEEPPP